MNVNTTHSNPSSAELNIQIQHKRQGGRRTQRGLLSTPSEHPLVSIVTVVLNGEMYLEEAIQSVLRQSSIGVEYLVIDGGSADGTVAILQKYERDIDYWVSEPDHGIYHAMNKGWDLSQGEFIYYLGADDELLSLPLQAIHDAIRDNIDIVFGDVILGNGRYFRSHFGFSLRFDNTLHHQGLFLRRSLFQTAPFNTQFRVFSDFDLNQRLYQQGKRALPTHLPTARFRLTRQWNAANSREFFGIVRHNFGFPTMLLSYVFLRLRGLVYRVLGWSH
jgi:glycosyltransferase involved in cell wall biosynthesis